jgi:hypothetical protein
MDRREKTEEEFEITVRELASLDNDDYEVWDEKLQVWISPKQSCYLKPGRGYAPTDDPFNRITAISVYNNWEETLYSLSLRPSRYDNERS